MQSEKSELKKMDKAPPETQEATASRIADGVIHFCKKWKNEGTPFPHQDVKASWIGTSPIPPRAKKDVTHKKLIKIGL